MANEEDEESADGGPGRQNPRTVKSIRSNSPLYREHWRKWDPYTPNQPQSRGHPRKTERYTRLLHQYKTEVLSPHDPLPVPRKRLFHLRDSLILNIPWTGEEKDKFFTALARCGRGNLTEVARRVGTKGLVEVTAYVGLLEEAAETRRKRLRAYDLRMVPAAIEVDEDWLKFEEKMARSLGKRESVSAPVEMGVTNLAEDGQLFNPEVGGELLEMYQRNLISYHKPIALSPQTAEAFNTIVTTQTRKLVRTVSLLVQARARNTHNPRIVTLGDARTAIDLLGLPRHFEQHFSTLPDRIPAMKEMLKGKVAAAVPTSSPGSEMDEGFGSSEALLMKQLHISRWTKTRGLWPEEWDVNHGFHWEYGDDEGDLENESDETTSTLGDVGSNVDPLRLETQSQPAEESVPDTGEDDEEEEEEKALLQAETNYLEALDSHHAEIELTRLRIFIKHGEKSARQYYEPAVQSFPSPEEGVDKVWSRAQEQLFLKFGDDWTRYKGEFAETDAPPAQPWESFGCKRNPEAILVEQKPKSCKLSGRVGRRVKEQKGKCGSSEEEEEEQSLEYSVYSD